MSSSYINQRILMKFTRLEIPDVILCEPKLYNDERGYFTEFYRQDKLETFSRSVVSNTYYYILYLMAHFICKCSLKGEDKFFYWSVIKGNQTRDH